MCRGKGGRLQEASRLVVSRTRICKIFWSPGIDAKESIPGLHKRLKIRALEGRYDNPIPPRFLAPIDSSNIPALEWECYCACVTGRSFLVYKTDQ